MICCFIAISVSYGQIPKQIYKSDSSKTEGFNYVIPSLNMEKAKDTETVVVILNGFLESPYSVFFESDLVEAFDKAGYTTIIPVLSKSNDGLYLIDAYIKKVHTLITDYLLEKKLPKDSKIILGGFSLGGTRAIKTYIHNLASSDQLNITHVFAIDPPLDFRRFLTAEKKSNHLELTPILANETDPQRLDRYIDSISIFNYEKLENFNTSLFKNIKLRIYNEPDLDWQFNHRNRNLMDLNLIDQSILTNHLKSIFPDADVELILSKIKGLRRQTNQRNPHSWNIVDTHELVKWLSP